MKMVHEEDGDGAGGEGGSIIENNVDM